uniref:Uncharacterized protein n=1 Tax=uncultured marine group II/III euryarchaeote KM3_13_D07 TaxID=1457872 RepID=A0A075GFX9_9EURY|nr:hypothetical protein [uncultured marine group II/III euryarchaeote KM3_13_D07]
MYVPLSLVLLWTTQLEFPERDHALPNEPDSKSQLYPVGRTVSPPEELKSTPSLTTPLIFQSEIEFHEIDSVRGKMCGSRETPKSVTAWSTGTSNCTTFEVPLG